MGSVCVIVVSDSELAVTLGRDFRWPVVHDPGHAASLVAQGFSLVTSVAPASVSAGVEVAHEVVVVEVPDGADAGAAHAAVHATPGLDPLKLNADMGVFGWVVRDDKVLLIRQAYGRRLWGLPGGEVELFEAPSAAVEREIAEETGITASAGALVAVYGRRQHIGLYFRAEATGGELRSVFDSEVADVGWFALDALPVPHNPVIDLLCSDLVSHSGAAARFF